MKNILFIMPDQLRADFLGCYGADFAITPNLDRLSSEGVTYERCVSPSPLCVPARASLLTGENAVVNGVLHNSVWLRPDHEECGQKSWAGILSDNGYATAAIGKMHFYPWDINEGFDTRIIAEDKRHTTLCDDYADFLKENGYKKYKGSDFEEYMGNKGSMLNPLPKELQVDNWVCEKSCDYIVNRDKDKPFALMVGFPSPHCPYDPDADDLDLFEDSNIPNPLYQTPEIQKLFHIMRDSYLNDWCGIDYTDFSDEQKQKMRRHYSALIYRLDVCIGRLIQTLKEQNIYENTTIIISSDHGDFIGDYGLVGKHFFYEPSIHVPLIVKDDALSKGVRHAETVSLTDVRAVILHSAGIEKCETEDSKLLSCYTGKKRDEFVFGATNIGVMITDRWWKYCKYFNGEIHLFDLQNDKYEKSNLYEHENHQKKLRELENVMQKKLLQSILKNNGEKTVDTQDANFSLQKWKRDYPNLILC